MEHSGSGGMAYYSVPAFAKERVLSLTDHEILCFIRPSRAEPGERFEPVVPAMAEEVVQEVDAEREPEPMEPQDPVAQLFDKLLTVLVRMDARFARLERELGLKPIEQEVDK